MKKKNFVNLKKISISPEVAIDYIEELFSVLSLDDNPVAIASLISIREAITQDKTYGQTITKLHTEIEMCKRALNIIFKHVDLDVARKPLINGETKEEFCIRNTVGHEWCRHTGYSDITKNEFTILNYVKENILDDKNS